MSNKVQHQVSQTIVHRSGRGCGLGNLSFMESLKLTIRRDFIFTKIQSLDAPQLLKVHGQSSCSAVGDDVSTEVQLVNWSTSRLADCFDHQRDDFVIDETVGKINADWCSAGGTPGTAGDASSVIKLLGFSAAHATHKFVHAVMSCDNLLADVLNLNFVFRREFLHRVSSL